MTWELFYLVCFILGLLFCVISLFTGGHTHGGHVALPGYRPIWIPSPVGKRYPWGRHEVDGTTLFVSRGVGGSLVPFRTWAPPDVAVFDVR